LLEGPEATAAPSPQEPALEAREERYENVYSEMDSAVEEEVAPRAKPPGFRPPPPTKAAPKRSLNMLGLIVFAAVLAGGYFLYQSWDTLFPNSEDAAAPPASPRAPDVIQRATRLRLDGKVAEAVAELEKIAEGDAHYSRARLLLDQWRSEIAASPPPATPTVATAEQLREREQHLERAREAYSEREYLLAAQSFRAAAAIQALDVPAVDLYDDAKRQLQPVAPQLDLFMQGEWEMILPALWRLREEDPQNKDVVRLLAYAYFNLGVRELRRGNPRGAVGNFKELAALTPDDGLAQRLYQFAAAYDDRPRDLLYRIFVGALEFRR
jgi:tetratricopeptide (TPR) repeat protein